MVKRGRPEWCESQDEGRETEEVGGEEVRLLTLQEACVEGKGKRKTKHCSTIYIRGVCEE